ncbi:MAG: FtsW/RodA/SpoVE family cell cycle protein [Spirochaetes bacterium]|uniref:Probable peptidoglycan glycosyltransferase FtsW n=1 Tax=Candidatus Ornithospirochaeta stercoripullorum TaxID=2840899 RepID=A0A9D9E1I0_9SPIO|nr:FtsW/RodA/SpoVE family cell cycle protein [Candidatus Ornithospirochaeta stercoripullorum]
MPRSEQRNYDDYSYSTTVKEKENAGSLSPFTYLCTVLIISLLGLVILYSSSYQKAIAEGLPHYYYFFRNLVAGLVALAISFGINLSLPYRILKVRYFLLPLTLVLLVLSIVPSFSEGGYIVISGYRIINPSYLAMFSLPFFASRFFGDVRKGKGYYIFAVLAVVMMLLSLISAGIGWYLILIISFAVLMRISGEGIARTGISFFILLLLGFIVSSVFPATTLEPVISSVYTAPDNPLEIAGSAIEAGGITGCGLGNGLFKHYLIASTESDYIFASFAEEVGYLGTAVLIVLLVFISVLGVRTVARAKMRHDLPSAMTVAAFTLFIVLASAVNMLYVAGFLPLPGVLLPFFSYDPAFEFISVLSSSMLYRLIYIMGRSNEKK